MTDGVAQQHSRSGDLHSDNLAPAWMLIGCRGSGMRALGRLLSHAGHVVFGMDSDSGDDHRSETEAAVVRVPWTTQPDWSRLNVAQVVCSPAVPADLPLLQSARHAGLTVRWLSEVLAEQVRRYRQICVAGTHGKSTTSAMISWILESGGLAPLSYVGADLLAPERPHGTAPGRRTSSASCADNSGSVVRSGDIAVIESCEFRRSFLTLRPSTIVLTGIERDHVDCFASDADADAAYEQFVAGLTSGGTLVLNASCPRSIGVAASAVNAQTRAVAWFVSDDGTPQADSPALSAGVLHEAPLWSARPLPRSVRQPDARGWRSQTFELRSPQGERRIVELPVPGRHNVENAIGAILGAESLGVSLDAAISALHSFPGVRRRFEDRGSIRGIQLIDDYAHHPTAVRSTLLTAQTVFPGRRVIAIFEPHQSSRLAALFEEFTDALALADETHILPVLPARETLSAGECRRQSEMLVRALQVRGRTASFVANLDQVPATVDHSARPGDVVITLGAGRTDRIHDELTRRIQRHFAA